MTTTVLGLEAALGYGITKDLLFSCLSHPSQQSTQLPSVSNTYSELCKRMYSEKEIISNFGIIFYIVSIGLPPIIEKYESAYASGNKSENANFIISIIVCVFAGIMFITLFLFGCSHLYMASKNITTNESLRKTYKRKPNPYNRGVSENLHVFWSVYPKYPSNLYHLTEAMNEGENKYYNKIMEKYGQFFTKGLSEKQKFNESDDEDDRNHTNLPDQENRMERDRSPSGLVQIY